VRPGSPPVPRHAARVRARRRTRAGRPRDRRGRTVRRRAGRRLRSPQGGRAAAIALLGPGDADRARIVDLGPTAGDVPPPKLVPRGADLIVAAYGTSVAHSPRSSTRDLLVRSLSPAGA